MRKLILSIGMGCTIFAQIILFHTDSTAQSLSYAGSSVVEYNSVASNAEVGDPNIFPAFVAAVVIYAIVRALLEPPCGGAPCPQKVYNMDIEGLDQSSFTDYEIQSLS